MGTMYKARAWTFDVWGNPDDGYEINDRFLMEDDLFIDASLLESKKGRKEFKEFIHRLYEFRRDIPAKDLELEDTGMGVFIFLDGIPCGEIEFLKEMVVTD